ncbi:MAG: DUF5979 domain-containing protein [Clostridiales bacterium]|nr:DUF5979 domain-containing protein [Clostridiales bacterium]
MGAYSVRLYDADSYSATSYDHVTAGQATCTDDDSTFYINHLPEGNYRIEYISMNPNFDISLYQVAGENAYSVELTDGQEYFAVISSFTLKEDTFIDWELEDFVESGLIEDDFQNLTVASLGGSYVKNSLNFTYNGTLTNRNFLYSSLMSKGSGLTEITSNLANNINRYYVIKQDNLDDAISKNCYLKFSNAFFTSDVNGNTTYYDVKIYFWGESLGSTTNKPAVGFTSTDRFVYGCQAHFDGDTSLGDGSGRFVLKSQYRFYPAGDSEENEVYPSGVFYTGDNDEDEGWCALNAGTLFTPFSDNTIKTATVQGNQYLVGTTDVTNQSASGEDPSADIGCYFSTSANGGRLRLAYTANDGRSSPVKGFYYTLKYHIVGKNGTPANASAKPMDINVARYINTSSQKATLFREMTAAGYIFNGWYTSSSDLSGTKYSGETSTTSNINVYAEFVPATGDLTIMKEINGWTSTLSTENRTFTFRLSGTSTTEETVDQTETLEFEAEAPTSKSVTFSDVPVGTYTLTETFTDRYWNTTTSTKTITIENSKTTTVNFTNTLKVGHLNVNKIIEEADPLLYIPSVEDRYNSSLAGFAFRLYGTSDYDTKIDLYAVTDSTGYAAFADVETGTYTLTEASLEDVMAAADQGNTNNGWCYTG